MSGEAVSGNVVVDFQTGEVVQTPLPVRDEVVHAMLVDLMRKNDEGRISVLICVMIDDLGDTSYDYTYPAEMPPALYVGALEVTKTEILRSVRTKSPSPKTGA